ncbi:MAG: hypothetical protein QHH05_00640 [Syntrophomonadaceae bacterium]|nr:hypothetical protein [Syntrophomonadaceae bacterium]
MPLLLVDAQPAPPVDVDPLLQGVIGVHATAPVPERIGRLLGLATQAVAAGLARDGVVPSPLAAVFFRGRVCFSLHPRQLAAHVSLALFDLDRLESRPEGQVLLIMVEELVHHCYRLHDEAATSRKVAELLPGVEYDPATGRYRPQ